jgi:hypothetical protein
MRMKSTFSEMREDFPEMKWTSINILDDPDGITQKFRIKQIPAMAVVRTTGVQKHVGTDITGYLKILKSQD